MLKTGAAVRDSVMTAYTGPPDKGFGNCPLTVEGGRRLIGVSRGLQWQLEMLPEFYTGCGACILGIGGRALLSWGVRFDLIARSLSGVRLLRGGVIPVARERDIYCG